MPERSKDWIRQAQRDMDSARSQLRDKFFEWACFIAQQAAEKAVKAVLQTSGAEAWGHSVTDLLKSIKEKFEVPDVLIEKGNIPLANTALKKGKVLFEAPKNLP